MGHDGESARLHSFTLAPHCVRCSAGVREKLALSLSKGLWMGLGQNEIKTRPECLAIEGRRREGRLLV